MSFEHALTEHSPRGVGDPFYIPWWAKIPQLDGDPKTFRAWDGTEIRGGKIVTQGSSFRGFVAELKPKLQTPGVENMAPSPRKVLPSASRPKGGAYIPDWAAEALREAGKDLGARVALCAKYGIDYVALVAGAPNPGVASMRVVNALRRAKNGES